MKTLLPKFSAENFRLVHFPPKISAEKKFSAKTLNSIFSENYYKGLKTLGGDLHLMQEIFIFYARDPGFEP